MVELEVTTHPSVVALQRGLPRAPLPDAVEVLKEKRSRSGVYRLVGSGPDGSAIIAKLGDPRAIARERQVYRTVLPALGTRGIELLGSVEDHHSGSWIFLEEVRGMRLRLSDPEHRRLAADWFARLHTHDWSAAGCSVPPRDLDAYRRTLEGAVAELAWVRESNRDIPPRGVTTLRSVEAQLRDLHHVWTHLEAACHDMPRTVVHGDVQAKNLLVSAEGDLLVLDWEHCVTGDPSCDLSPCLDPQAYRERAVEAWPWLTRCRLRRMVDAGAVLRMIDAIAWENRRLDSPRWRKALRHMEAYGQELYALDLEWLGISTRRRAHG